MSKCHGKNTYASSMQIVIADMYCIPRRLAHTVNTDKVRGYQDYRRRDETRLEDWLDRQDLMRYARLKGGGRGGTDY